MTVTRKSRASKPQVAPHLFFKRSDNDPVQVVQFWAWFQAESRKLSKKFPFMTAERRKFGDNAGEWIIFNASDRGDKHGERAFRDLATQAASRIGYHGGPQGAVQFFLDHMHGDHTVMAKLPDVNPNEIDFYTEHNDQDGTRELHIGRYKQGGEWSDMTNAALSKPMEIPRPVVMPEPLIKVVGS